MEEKDKDTLIITAALKRFNEFRFPRIQSLKKKVDGGEVLNEMDLTFLRRVFDSAEDLDPIIQRHPEYISLRDKAASICEAILKKSEENETGE